MQVSLETNVRIGKVVMDSLIEARVPVWRVVQDLWRKGSAVVARLRKRWGRRRSTELQSLFYSLLVFFFFSFFFLCHSVHTNSTYHAVSAFASLGVDTATASARVVGARVHDEIKAGENANAKIWIVLSFFVAGYIPVKGVVVLGLLMSMSKEWKL